MTSCSLSFLCFSGATRLSYHKLSSLSTTFFIFFFLIFMRSSCQPGRCVSISGSHKGLSKPWDSREKPFDFLGFSGFFRRRISGARIIISLPAPNVNSFFHIFYIFLFFRIIPDFIGYTWTILLALSIASSVSLAPPNFI